MVKFMGQADRKLTQIEGRIKAEKVRKTFNPPLFYIIMLKYIPPLFMFHN